MGAEMTKGATAYTTAEARNSGEAFVNLGVEKHMQAYVRIGKTLLAYAELIGSEGPTGATVKAPLNGRMREAILKACRGDRPIKKHREMWNVAAQAIGLGGYDAQSSHVIRRAIREETRAVVATLLVQVSGRYHVVEEDWGTEEAPDFAASPASS